MESNVNSPPHDTDKQQQRQFDNPVGEGMAVNADQNNRKDPFGGKKVKMAFPEKLMCILDDKDFQHCIFWSKEGDAFGVYPNLFTEHVLGPFFQGSKFHSFTRKLNRFAFKRIIGDSRFPQEAFAFQHKLFVRGKPELMVGMKEGSRSSGSSTDTSRKRGILKNAQEPLTRVVPGTCTLQQNGSIGSIAANGFGMGGLPFNIPNTTGQISQQNAVARPLSALEMLQHHQLQSLLQIQQHNAQHSAFPILSGTNLQALLRQSNSNTVDYGHHSLSPNNSEHGQRPLALPTDADLLRLLSNNPSGGISQVNNDPHASLLSYLQRQFNNGRG